MASAAAAAAAGVQAPPNSQDLLLQQQQQQPQPPHPPSILLHLDLDLTPVPGQQAWVVLDLTGRVVRTSSDNAGISGSGCPPTPLSLHKDVPILFRMLSECASLMTTEDGGLKRMTVTFGNSNNHNNNHNHNNHNHNNNEDDGVAPDSTGPINTNNNSNNIRYVVARDETHVYMIQTSSSSSSQLQLLQQPFDTVAAVSSSS